MLKKVVSKLKSILTNNIGLKIVAVIIAAIVWLAVVNINDPEKTIVIYNVPVTITDEEVLSEQEMVYDNDIDYTVNVTVRGKRSVVTKLNTDDFEATASLKELSRVNAIPISVRIKNSSSARGVTIVKQSVQTISIEVENITQKEFDIDAEFRGSLPNGYVQGDYTLYTNKVTINAPASALNKIDKVVAACRLDDITEDIVGKKCRIILYDEKGKEIKTKKNRIKLSVKKVKMDVDILKEITVAIAPLTTNSVGSPAKNCIVKEVNLKQDSIKVIGQPETLEGLTQIDISSKIDISKDDKDVTKKVDVTGLLPDGVTVDGQKTIAVEIKINKFTTKNLSIPSGDIEINNLSDTMTAQIVSKKISIEFSGEDDVLKDLSTSDVTVGINLSEMTEEGEQSVKADVQAPDGVTAVNSVTVKVKLEKK